MTNEEKMAFLAENQGNLSDLGSMMEKMQGVCRIEQPEGVFRMTLLFKTAKE